MSLLTTATWWFNIVFVNVHTPTEKKKEEDNENFYSLLDSTLSNITKNSFILEDFNAKIEKKEYFKPTIGSHSLHHIFQMITDVNSLEWQRIRISKLRALCSRIKTFTRVLGQHQWSDRQPHRSYTYTYQLKIFKQYFRCK